MALSKHLIIIAGWRKYTLLFCIAMNLTSITLGVSATETTRRLTDLFLNGRGSLPTTSEWWPPLAKLTLIGILLSVINILRQYVEQYAETFLQQNVQAYALFRFLGKDMSFFAHPMTNPEMIATRVGGESMTFYSLIHGFPFQLIQNLYTLILYSEYLLADNDTPVAMLFAAGLHQPFVAILVVHQSKWNRRMQPFIEQLKNRVKAVNADIMRNIPFIKMAMVQDEVLAMRTKDQYENQDLSEHVINMSIIYQSYMATLMILTQAAVWIMGLSAVSDGKMTFGEFRAFLDSTVQMNKALTTLGALVVKFSATYAMASNVARMLDTAVVIERHADSRVFFPERPPADEMPGTAGSEVSEGIRRSLARRQQVLRPVDVRLQRLDHEM